MISARERIRAVFPAADSGTSADGIPFLRVVAMDMPEIAFLLRDQLGYGRFIDLTAVDDPSREDRFELQYLFYSLVEKGWLRIKTRTALEAPSLTAWFAAADWFEREVFDMFGVRFVGHPDLKRILMPDEWPTYPLRRDEPVGGEPVDFVATRDVHGNPP